MWFAKYFYQTALLYTIYKRFLPDTIVIIMTG